MVKAKHLWFAFFTTLFIILVVLGVYGFFEDYPIFEDYSTIIGGLLILSGFVLYTVLLRFSLKYSLSQILDAYAYVVGSLFALAVLLAYFFLWEIYSLFIYSFWVNIICLGIGAASLIIAYYLAPKKNFREPFLFLLFGCELSFIGIITLVAGRFLI